MATLNDTWARAQIAAPDTRLTKAEQNICQDLDMCVEILLRHAPDSFDYKVLTQDFQRFNGGLGRLLQFIGSDREKGVRRAQYILADASWQFSPAAQAEIAKLWPRGDIKAHSRVMVNIGTPLMRDRVIATLSHEDENVRAQSREILKLMTIEFNGRDVSEFTSAALPSAAFQNLVKAGLDAPTPEIITLIGTFPAAQSKPVLSRFLLSEDAQITGEAYAQLYKQNPDIALAAFKSSLPNLKTTQQALSLSRLLQNRHTERHGEIKDGFYMHFAHALLIDKTLPPLAHMMAMDAIMNSAPLAEKNLPDKAQVHQAFLDLIKTPDVPLTGYASDFDKKTNLHAVRYLPLIWDALLTRDKDLNYTADTSQAIYAFARSARNMMPDPKLRPALVSILDYGLSYDKDWRVQKEAALGLGEGQVRRAQNRLNIMATSAPVNIVRGAAQSALTAMNSVKIEMPLEAQSNANLEQRCEVDGFDFTEDSKQLPFFESGQFFDSWETTKVPAHRRLLSSAFPTKTGWLAGYDAGKFGGGLLHYDNVSGDHDIILNGNIIAITPIKPTPLGTSASEFWVVEGLVGSRGKVYYVRFENDKTIVKRHVELPSRPNAIEVMADQSLLMSFEEDYYKGRVIKNSPLRLLPNGKIVSGCEAPQSAAQQSLPN